MRRMRKGRVRVPLFVMIGQDGPEGADRREEHRVAHVAHVEALDGAGRIHLAGPIRDEKNTRSVGAVIVFEAPSLEEAWRVANEDPYVTGGVFASVTVAPFTHVYPKAT